MTKRILIFLLLVLTAHANAQSLDLYEDMISEETLREKVDYLSDDLMEGRSSGTVGNYTARSYITDQFKFSGLKPYNWSYTQSVPANDSIIVRNVVGLLPAIVESDEYVIISAHYDHLGKMDGKVYNGADDNASGVAVMLSLVEMFAQMKENGVGPKKNLIFVAFDGKEMNMAGSRQFVSNLAVPKKNIVCDINLDMLGTDLVPPRRNKEYIIFLGEEKLKESYRGIVPYLAGRRKYKMDLDQTFYGSRDFARFFYGMSDQIIFDEEGIPAVTFSSGFHDFTYKPTDDPGIINYSLLKKRTWLIFNFVERVAKY